MESPKDEDLIEQNCKNNDDRQFTKNCFPETKKICCAEMKDRPL